MEYVYETFSISEEDAREYNSRHPDQMISRDTYVKHELENLRASGYEFVSGPAIFVNRQNFPVYVFTFKREAQDHPEMVKRDW